MKTINIPVHIGHKLVSKGSNWQLGVWELPKHVYDKEARRWIQTEEIRQIWGLVFEGDYTHMCYELPYANPKKKILKRRENYRFDPDVDWLRWYFDVGRKLYVTLDELERCCKLLDIWQD